MSRLLHFGEIVAMNAYLSPDKVGEQLTKLGSIGRESKAAG